MSSVATINTRRSIHSDVSYVVCSAVCSDFRFDAGVDDRLKFVATLEHKRRGGVEPLIGSVATIANSVVNLTRRNGSPAGEGKLNAVESVKKEKADDEWKDQIDYKKSRKGKSIDFHYLWWSTTGAYLLFGQALVEGSSVPSKQSQ